MNVSHSPDIKGPSVISLTVTGCKPHPIKPKNPTYGIRTLFTWWPNISASPLSDLIHLLMPDSVFLFGNFITDFIQINFCSSSISLLFFALFHWTAALWWPSRTADGSISCGSGRPIHTVVHHAPGPNETRAACETSLPWRHCHAAFPRPTEQG